MAPGLLYFLCKIGGAIRLDASRVDFINSAQSSTFAPYAQLLRSFFVAQLARQPKTKSDPS